MTHADFLLRPRTPVRQVGHIAPRRQIVQEHGRSLATPLLAAAEFIERLCKRAGAQVCLAELEADQPEIGHLRCTDQGIERLAMLSRHRVKNAVDHCTISPVLRLQARRELGRDLPGETRFTKSDVIQGSAHSLRQAITCVERRCERLERLLSRVVV